MCSVISADLLPVVIDTASVFPTAVEGSLQVTDEYESHSLASHAVIPIRIPGVVHPNDSSVWVPSNVISLLLATG